MNRHKLFYYVLIIVIVGIIIAYLVEGFKLAAIVLSVSVIALFISKALWLPEGEGKYRVRIISIVAAVAVFSTYSFWQSFLTASLRTYFPDIAKNYEEVPPALLLVFIAFVLFIVNFFNRDNTAMGILPEEQRKIFPLRTHKEAIKGLVVSLTDALKIIDNKTNWSSSYFVPLDAEVEITSNNRKQKKIVNLLKALRASKDRLFLILGDPGSGKSVSLRKLAQDLGNEAAETGKIPIYVNLKDWHSDEQWTETNPPRSEHLKEFILNNIKNRDITISRFLSQPLDNYNTMFDSLYETGRLYFILDSFDEIPFALNEPEDSWLIQALSQAIFVFLKGSRNISSQGVLSSRFFRKPTFEFQCNTIFEIRPLSEIKVNTLLLQRISSIRKNIGIELFRQRPNLIPASRNPFSATLIAEYILHNDKLPDTQAQIYEDYFKKIIQDCSNRMSPKGLSYETILEFSKSVAHKMFIGNKGWEISVKDIKNEYENAGDIIDVLRFARIGRSGEGDDSNFSFVHRRFAEYFMVLNILEDKMPVEYQSIPDDSQQRDALVLYCEVAAFDKAKEIADYTWGIIKDKNNLQEKGAIHSFRFLNDAFKSRKECIEHIMPEIDNFIGSQIKDENKMLSIKLAIEGVGLLSSDLPEKHVANAMSLGNHWISETAFNSCRNLSNISVKLQDENYSYISSLSSQFILRNYKEYSFALCLSESFSNSRLILRLRYFDAIQFSLIFLIAVVVLPSYYLGLTVYAIIFSFMITKLFDSSGRYFVSIEKSVDSFRYSIGSVFLFLILYSLYKESIVRVNDLTVKNSSDFYSEMLVFLFFCSSVFCFFIEIINIKILKKRYYKRLLSAFVLATAGGIMYLGYELISYIKHFISKTFPDLYFILKTILYGGVLALLFIISGGLLYMIHSTVKSVIKYLKEKKMIDSMDFSNLSRVKIYHIYMELSSDRIKFRFIQHLEVHTRKVSGEWPDKDFLKVSSDSKEIRLAKLDEKWLGLDK